MSAPLPSLVEEGAPVETIALAIARDVHPKARVSFEGLATDASDVAALRRHVFGELGFRGADDYDDPRANLIDEVLTRREGSPVLLAVVMIAIGRRSGLTLEPIAFPGNFLVRFEGAYVDPFDGRELPYERLVELATETLGDRAAAVASLEPVGPRTVAVRIVQNLLRIYQARAEHAWALLLCDRLLDLTGAPDLLADRGAHALAAGAVRASIADFTAYLDDHPGAPDAPRVRQVLRRARQLLTPSN